MKDSQSNARDEQTVAVNNNNKRQQLGESVRKNTELYKNLFLEALDGIIFWTNEEGIIEANHSACHVFELDLDELKHKRLEDFLFDEIEHYRHISDELNRKGSVRDELLFLMPNGQKKILEFTTKYNSVDGHHMTILRNVTERHEMEKELRKREQTFRSIFEGTVEGLLLWNNQYEIVDINPAGEEIFQTTKEKLIGKSILQALLESNVLEEEIRELVKALKGKGQDSGFLSLYNQFGEKIDLEYSSKLNIFSNLNLTTFRDITDKLKIEERLQKSDALNVIGELAAGIAHEIRNPMTALKGFVQLLEDTLKNQNPLYFDVINNELERIESIINEFLILAKPQVIKYERKDIVQILKETMELLRPHAVLHNIQFRFVLKNEIPLIFCEPNQLKKVFINLIKNAIEVMQQGGFITVGINLSSQERVHIFIEDEGEGIPPEKLKKLGKPFFTTKEKGTGLGLMVSYRIIEEHHGKIEVESIPGKGSVFHIYLPID